MNKVMGVAALAGMVAVSAWAHHGWGGFDDSRPLYLEGMAKTVRWQNPHAELTLEVPAGLALPADLAGRRMPAQQAPVDAAAILGKTTVPTAAAGEWRIELAPLSRMNAWKIAEIRPGERVAMVGYAAPGQQGPGTLRVEYLFSGGGVYALRSSPTP